MKQQLAALLRDLEDDAAPPQTDRLPVLSDLDAEGMKDLQRVWPRLSPERRLDLLSQLRQLADERIELTFEKINRLALSDPAAEVRRQAIGNLWECEDPALVTPLSQALTSDPDPTVREAAAAALGQFVYLGELERLPEHLRLTVEEGLLRAVSHDPARDVQLASLEALGFSSRAELPALIEAAYRSGEEMQVRAALVAMSRSANATWGPAVNSELSSPLPRLRLEAARAAGELDLRDAVPTLIELLEDVSEEVRRASIWSLGQLGGKLAERALQDLARRKPPKDEAELLEEALENLAFVDGTRNLLMLDFDDSPEDEH